MENENKKRPSKVGVMQLVILSNSVNPLIAVLKDMESFFDYGTLSESIGDINELLNFWYAEDEEKENVANPHYVTNRLHRITGLTTFLVSLHENFMKLKENNHDLGTLLNDD